MTSSMPLTALEMAALSAIAGDYPGNEAELRSVFLQCRSTGRSNTGFGFFTDLECAGALATVMRSPLGDAQFDIEGMAFPFGCLVFHNKGIPTLLEGYSCGGEDTTDIDFSTVKFSLRQRPE